MHNETDEEVRQAQREQEARIQRGADPERVKRILDDAPDARYPRTVAECWHETVDMDSNRCVECGHLVKRVTVAPALIAGIKASFAELQAVQGKQRVTTAKMIRACLSRIKSPDSRKRREGIAGLEQLAEMLEKTDG